MIIGVPSEVKQDEYRVAMLPVGAQLLTQDGHAVLIEKNAGLGSGFSNDDYSQVGAEIVDSANELYDRSEMIVKVKEPQPEEIACLRKNQIVFCYFHFASSRTLTAQCLERGISAVAYETLTDEHDQLPLLTPMSEVAGRMSIQAGAYCLEHPHGGLGMLLGGVPGVDPAKVVILGAGVVGTHATHIAVGMGADVWVIDRNPDAIEAHWRQFGRGTNSVFSTDDAIERHVLEADLVIGGVLIPGAEAPKLVTAEMVKKMKPGAVIVDVAIDQGGCCETSRATTHAEPTYIVDEVVHYCVANMPGGVPRTSTYALNNATLPYILTLADKGYVQALKDDVHLRNGLNVHRGKVTYKPVAEVLGYDYHSPESVLS